jgi:hypothetical protein
VVVNILRAIFGGSQNGDTVKGCSYRASNASFSPSAQRSIRICRNTDEELFSQYVILYHALWKDYCRVPDKREYDVAGQTG